MKCSVCKKEIPSKSRVCPYCGNVSVKEVDVDKVIKKSRDELKETKKDYEKEIKKEPKKTNKNELNKTILFALPVSIILFILSFFLTGITNENVGRGLFWAGVLSFESFILILIYLLYINYNNREVFKGKNKVVLVLLFMVALFLNSFTIIDINGITSGNFGIINIINFLIIFITTSLFIKINDKKPKKETKFFSVDTFYLITIISLLMFYMYSYIPSLWDKFQVNDDMMFEEIALEPLCRSLLFVNPLYLVYFALCTWINSKHFSFRWLIYPVMLILFFSILFIIAVTMGSYTYSSDSAGAIGVIFLLVPAAIIVFISFIIGLLVDAFVKYKNDNT